MTIIDTHAHIDELEDLSGALERAFQAGVSDIVAVSVNLDSMKKLLDIAARHQQPKIHPALGIHPGMVKEPTQTEALDFMRANIKSAAAVGETGLDYWYKWVRKDEVERGKQKESFAFHLELARETALPIVIHSRGAWRDCLSMTVASGVKRALFHWYSGPVDILAEIIAAGFYVSTGPSVAYSPESRRAMTEAPLERIVVETDTPVNYRDGEQGFSAEPKDVTRAWKALAQLKNLDEQKTLETLNANARTFFGI
ncbi:MAG: TatD family hydrolase [Candidatus Omnitrophica bacterium]|nr:TatD family hydrolase [Candidatus Omnitrophota bacterium]MDE2223146.1 TatD family hydrolase [Candidatus Omnitrophota bacterium]